MRIEQVNSLLQTELGNLIIREIPTDNFLITITYVDTAPNLASVKIGVSILPDRYSGTALKFLKAHSSIFSRSILKNTRLRKVPHFIWEIDATEKKASEIEEILSIIRE
ncbi:MAG: ribosome-binding factor A [Patescibacteria group bacterium]|nr:ribosome-binding factor A [Patescibacteria group bacterium]MDD4610566.1 ribosome-binding factor A [Patescibacteria group bacterium]